MRYAVALGSDMFVGANGILSVESGGEEVDFFRIREIYRVRSEGSYLTVDTDIKDKDGQREIKLFKNRPVAEGEDITVEYSREQTLVTRADGSTIIKVEQIDPNDPMLPSNGPVRDFLDKNPIDAIIRITGEFYAGDCLLTIGEKKTFIKSGMMEIEINGNLSVGTSGIRLSNIGFSF
jgi:hypothetical protein